MTVELIEVPVGGDRFRAHVLLEAVRAAGIEAELMTGDDSGVDPFLGMVQGHRLLIAAVDQYRVQAVLERVR